MPEEINRIVTDSIADLLWTPSADANANLLSEGVSAGRIELIGNIMIDAFEMMREKIAKADTVSNLNPQHSPYAMVTLHRPSNVDNPDRLAELVAMIEHVAEAMLIIFPVHPRTRRRLQEYGLDGKLTNHPRIRVTDPLGYIEFMNLIQSCTIAFTDSGGIQEETTYLGIPCATLRENTERPITVTQGTNRLIRSRDIPVMASEALAGTWPKGVKPEYWDGRSAERAVLSLKRFVAEFGTGQR
jgi:UDP-N-acetylglucosamine 2-epimerase (non-hydrolysing)